MSEPVVAQKSPFEFEVKEGRKYWWCACGKSANQPFCDGSHKDTEFHARRLRGQAVPVGLFLRLQEERQRPALRRRPQRPIVRAAMTALRRAGILAGLLVALAGCGVFDKEPPKPCPVALVLKEAGEVVRYQPGAGRDLLDVAYRASFGQNSLECHYKGSRLAVALDVEVIAERGPGAGAGEARIPYFRRRAGRAPAHPRARGLRGGGRLRGGPAPRQRHGGTGPAPSPGGLPERRELRNRGRLRTLARGAGGKPPPPSGRALRRATSGRYFVSGTAGLLEHSTRLRTSGP